MKPYIKLLKILIITAVLLIPFLLGGGILGGIVIYMGLFVLMMIVEFIRKECFGHTDTFWDPPGGSGT